MLPLQQIRHVLQKKVLVASDTDTTLISDIKERIYNYLESKYLGNADFEDTINIASFLDPRFKAQHIDDVDLLLIKHRVMMESVARFFTTI